MKILVVAPSWIGDTILAQPLLGLLKQQYPDARIEMLAAAWSAPLLARMAEVDAVITNPFGHGEFNWSARRALGRQLASAGFDQAYVLPNSWKSALLPFFAGIKKRIGYHGEARYLLLNQRHRLDTQRHPQLVQRYAALAGVDATNTLRPHLISSPEQQAAARKALSLPLDSRPVVFCPGAEYGPAKRWPVQRFAELAVKVGAGEPTKQQGGQAKDAHLAVANGETAIWLIGSAKDREAGEEIVALSGGKVLNLCGRTNLEQAIDLIAGARWVVSNDSGLMHVAAALGRPLTALYGSSSPGYTPPLSADATIVTLNLPCSPCFKRECPLGHLDCLKLISTEQVLRFQPH